MKKQIELTCATCGEKFTAEADYILEGIEGFATNREGKLVTFLDPTADHHCDDCVAKVIENTIKACDDE